MNKIGIPQKQGLYDPSFEHDACGVGFVAHIKGKRSHSIVRDALQVLVSLDHRGARGAEDNTGDGAGILMQIPDKFFRDECMDIFLPNAGDYGVAMMFLPPYPSHRSDCEKLFEQIVAEEGQEMLGWRTVPTRGATLGRTARRYEPLVRQAFIGKGKDVTDQISFERKLFVIRRRAELEIRHAKENRYFYISSLSSRTIVYKGMLTPQQVSEFYPELSDPLVDSAIALVHSRFSTNTFPSWERAHPYRYVIHNGEINTLRSNVNWMHARQALLASEAFGKDLKKLFPVIDHDGSDSAMFDNCLEFLHLAGRSLPHAVMMMIPEPWVNHGAMDDDLRAFYQYHSCLMEPWDGPASIAFTDGTVLGAVLDRNGLRPSRYYVTDDDRVVMASEAGVLDIPTHKIVKKGRLQPGQMFLIDTAEGRIVSDEEIKRGVACEKPYQKWLDENLIHLSRLPEGAEIDQSTEASIVERQQAFGYTFEDLKMSIEPMAKDGEEPLGSMGVDTPPAVLSDRPQLLYNYFKQMFAQVTNPPIDAIREEIVTSVETTIGPERNILDPQPESCRQIVLQSPYITNEELAKLKHIDQPGFKSAVLQIVFDPKSGGDGIKAAMENLYKQADEAIAGGATIIILSDRGISREQAAIPALLAVAGMHHHLIREGARTRVGLVLESGEPREVHHFSLLVGYGVGAVNPYLAFETIRDMIDQGMLTDVPYEKAVANYIKACVKGIVKTMSKMGISTIQSYRGAQIFEALGISHDVIDDYFTWTPSRIEGIGLDEIARESAMRHAKGFPARSAASPVLETGGDNKWRSNGEYHMFNPETVYRLQQSCRQGDYSLFKQYSELINEQTTKHHALRGLLEFRTDQAIPIDEVESVESIVKRFKTGAMSYGSISKEAHEAIAIAMNRLGGKSNTGEGGEDPARFTPLANGDSKCSAIKQVASGRFGVTSHYLVNAKELQIKMAQGAKPGEGGQLPGGKVYPWIGKVRLSTPGVGLISPPPHHDIYSIEDLAELIFDLKNANRDARISVKLVSEAGVGTIAAGVAKAHADVILISGYDGGTGASPRSSIRHAGLPWELGIAETHQTLVLNNLRNRVILETDGKLLTGRDVAIAALLGAEEFGFSTAPLIVLGCIMMRVCHLDTCPAGVATQNPELRSCFDGDPEYVVNFMKFIAAELREVMASLGFRTVEEMVGRSDKLFLDKGRDHWKAKGVDLSAVLYQPEPYDPDVLKLAPPPKKNVLDGALDLVELLPIAKAAIEDGTPVEARLKIKTNNRSAGTILGSEVSRRYGAEGLPEDTIKLHFTGSAGQSFGAFVPKGITLTVEGDANDYLGKGLSGGKIVVYPPADSPIKPEKNIVIGNVAFYGATSGEAYIRGMAGERFCVRNSGVRAVVEAVGDHGCEYMTGGRVVVLGPTGRNFAAGMSGGVAYVYDRKGDFLTRCNLQMVELERLEHEDEIAEVHAMISRHAELTGSAIAADMLAHWRDVLPRFVRVMPKDYKRMLESIEQATQSGLAGDEAVLAAFEYNKTNSARAGGK